MRGKSRIGEHGLALTDAGSGGAVGGFDGVPGVRAVKLILVVHIATDGMPSGVIVVADGADDLLRVFTCRREAQSFTVVHDEIQRVTTGPSVGAAAQGLAKVTARIDLAMMAREPWANEAVRAARGNQ